MPLRGIMTRRKKTISTWPERTLKKSDGPQARCGGNSDHPPGGAVSLCVWSLPP